jgi:hypothetical protein
MIFKTDKEFDEWVTKRRVPNKLLEHKGTKETIEMFLMGGKTCADGRVYKIWATRKFAMNWGFNNCFVPELEKAELDGLYGTKEEGVSIERAR